MFLEGFENTTTNYDFQLCSYANTIQWFCRRMLSIHTQQAHLDSKPETTLEGFILFKWRRRSYIRSCSFCSSRCCLRLTPTTTLRGGYLSTHSVMVPSRSFAQKHPHFCTNIFRSHVLRLYSENQCANYRGKHIGALPPHPFAIADAAYRALVPRWCEHLSVVVGYDGLSSLWATALRSWETLERHNEFIWSGAWAQESILHYLGWERGGKDRDCENCALVQ